MEQLVGQNCVLCGRRIGSVLEGHFCASCGCPVHEGCPAKQIRKPDTCDTCGAEGQLAAEHRERQRQDAAVLAKDVQSYHSLRHLIFGALWLSGGVAFSVFSYGIADATGASRFWVASGAIGGGLGEMIYGFVLMWRVANGRV